MAGGGKEYTMTFLLKAASDSSYQAAFAKAKQELSTYQKAIQENNTLLKDISAYQRQEQAVERASAKVAQKAQALREAQAAAAAAGNATGTHTAAELKAEAALKNANEQLRQQEAKLRQQGDALQQAGVDTSNLTGEQTRLTNATSDLKREQEALADSQNAMLDEMAEMEALAAEAYVVAQAVGQLAQEWKECVDAASGFESAMSGVQAVSGSTKEEMSELNAVAKQLGADTVYTATEIAEAMEYMGLAGWNTQEIIEGIPAVVSLTAAAGEDLSRVSDIVTDSMQALGYGTEDTAHFCDVLANTVTNANTTVDLMGDTLKYVASTAGALGYSIEDVSTAIADMANNGIKGSINGTALRNILSNLAAPSDEAAAALDELGVSLVDNAGNTKALYDVITSLRSGFAELTEAEKVSYAATIAGKRGMSGLLAIVNTTQAEYDALTETISDCEGAAEAMAAVRMDNLAGSVEILDGAVDALKTSIGEVYLDDLSIGAEALAEIVDGLGEFVQANPEAVAGLTTTIGLFGGVAVAVPAATAAIKLFNTVMAGSALANPVFWGITALISGLTGIGVAAYKAYQNTNDAFERFGMLSEDIQTFEYNEGLIENYRTLQAEVQDAGYSEEELAEVQTELNATVEALKESYPELLGELEAGTEAWDIMTKAIEANNEAKRLNLIESQEANATNVAREYQEAAAEYHEAVADSIEAEKLMRETLDGTGDTAEYQNIVEMADALREDLASGLVEASDSAGEYQDRIDAMANSIYALTGLTSADIEFDSLTDIYDWIDSHDELDMSVAEYAGEYADALVRAAEAQAEMDEAVGLVQELIDIDWLTPAEAAEQYGLSLSTLGYTAKDVLDYLNSSDEITYADAVEYFGDGIQDLIYDLDNLGEAETAVAAATAEAEEAQWASYKAFWQSSYALAAVSSELLTAEAAAVAFDMDLETLNEQLELQEEYEANVAAACAAVEAGYLDAETAAERFGVTLGAMDAYNASVQLEALTEEMEALQEAYDSAYSSALSSMQGQMSLLEGLSLDAERTRLTVSTALESMNNTASYWQNYRSNMEALQGYGLSTDFLNRFADGSSESAGYLEDLVIELDSMSSENAQTAVENINSAFEGMVTQEEATAAATADLKTDYSAAMSAMQQEISALESTVSQEMTEIVAEFNKSSQARANGLATANAFVNAIWSKVSAAKEAAAALAAAGTPSSGSSSAWADGYFAAGGFTNGPSVAGEDPRYPTEAVISFNPAYRDENIGYLMKAAEMLGFGSGGTMDYMEDGTVYQYQGLTEYGQAMMSAYMEASKPAEAAPIYLGSGSGSGSPVNVTVEYSPTISVSAGETAQSIRQQLSDCDDILLDKILGVIEELERDKARRNYGY